MITLEQIESELGPGILDIWKRQADRAMIGTHFEYAEAAARHGYEYQFIVEKYEGWVGYRFKDHGLHSSVPVPETKSIRSGRKVGESGDSPADISLGEAQGRRDRCKP